MKTTTKLNEVVWTEYGVADIVIENNEGSWLGVDLGDGDFDYLQDNGEYIPVTYNNILNDVLTAAEAAESYGLSESAVRKAIERNQIPARKSAGTWLIRRADAEKRWGKK
jgi:excisionase family DNA binding protein